jgi:hypothetical protein
MRINRYDKSIIKKGIRESFFKEDIEKRNGSGVMSVLRYFIPCNKLI